MKSLISLATAVFLLASIETAQAQNSTAVSDNDLLTRTAAATRAIVALGDGIEADRSALSKVLGDISKAREIVRTELPPKPASIEGQELSSMTEVEERAAAFSAYYEAFKRKRAKLEEIVANHDAATKLISGLVTKSNEREKAASDARSLLIELERRVTGGAIKPEQVQLDAKYKTVAEWSAAAEELVASAPKDKKAFEDQNKVLEGDRTAAAAELAALVPEDDVYRIEDSALKTMIAAKNIFTTDRAEFEKNEPASMATAIGRIAEQAERDRVAYDDAVKKVEEARGAVGAIEAERTALKAPKLEEVPEGEGHAELKTAARLATLSEKLVQYQETRISILQRLGVANAALRSMLADASDAHTGVFRQTARLIAATTLMEEWLKDGKVSEYRPAEGVERANLWTSLKKLAFADARRRDESTVLEAKAKDTSASESAARDLAAEKTEFARLQGILNEELTYAGFLDEMKKKAPADLLALFTENGDIQTRLSKANTTAGEAEQATNAGELRLRQIRAIIGSIESPHTQWGFRQLSKIQPEVQAEVEGLRQKGAAAVPTDQSSSAQLSVAPSSVVNVEPQIDNVDDNLLAAAQRERKSIEKEKGFASELTRYFVDLSEQRDRFRTTVKELDEFSKVHLDRLSGIVSEEKRKYAAAREIEGRVTAGQLRRRNTPRELSRWASRDDVVKAQKSRDDWFRRYETARVRRARELERIEQILAMEPCAKARSDFADKKSKHVGLPVTHLASARTPFDELKDVDKRNLMFEADSLRAENERTFVSFLEYVADAKLRERYEVPLEAQYLELVDRERVVEEFDKARDGYEKLTTSATEQQSLIAPYPALLREAEAQRVFDYHAARYLAAIAASPDDQTKLMAEFRAGPGAGRDLIIPADTRNWDKTFFANQLFAAEARLLGHRKWQAETDAALSKLGLEAEIGRYRSLMADIGAARDAETSAIERLNARMAEVRESYTDRLKVNALWSLFAILAVPALAWFLTRIVRRIARRVEQPIGIQAFGIGFYRQKRLQTLSKATAAAISVVIWTGAGIYVLRLLGMDITPIIASASVVGLAVAFGAQALIRDFFCGFFILIENQYTLGDVVDVGGISGLVERITLRVTQLRDVEGVVHYVPNGTVSRVSNKTQGWSCAVLEIGVAYEEDTDHVSDVLRDVMTQMCADENWKNHIIETPVVAGVERFEDSAVAIRVIMKTQPGRQWDVSRELRRRIKKRFDEEGITIPFPQRVVHHRGGPAPTDEAREIEAAHRE